MSTSCFYIYPIGCDQKLHLHEAKTIRFYLEALNPDNYIDGKIPTIKEQKCACSQVAENMKVFRETGYEPNQGETDCNNMTSFMCAAYKGDIDYVNKYLESDNVCSYDIHVRNTSMNYWSALDFALYAKHYDVARAIFDHHKSKGIRYMCEDRITIDLTGMI